MKSADPPRRHARRSRDWPRVGTGALPNVDPTIDALSASERDAVGAVWSSRAAKELATAQTFAMMFAGLAPRAVEAQIAWIAARAIGDEVRHAEICRHVASAYRRLPEGWPTAPILDAPQPGTAGPELTSTLLVVLHCCMNETIACAFVRACQDDARGPLTRAALREILRDEIDHARLGWAHLASPLLTATIRRAVAAEIPALLETCRSLWLDRKPPDIDPPRGHGCPPFSDLPRIVDNAVVDLIVPGLREVGILPA